MSNLNEFKKGILDIKKLEFKETEGGFLSLKMGEEEYPLVKLYRAFPVTDPSKYIYIIEEGEKEKELGFIKDISLLDEKVREMIEKNLELIYFVPEITEIKNLKEEFGYYYWEVNTTAGKTVFTTKRETIKYMNDGSIVMIDVNGARFAVKDMEVLQGKFYKDIEALL